MKKSFARLRALIWLLPLQIRAKEYFSFATITACLSTSRLISFSYLSYIGKYINSKRVSVSLRKHYEMMSSSLTKLAVLAYFFTTALASTSKCRCYPGESCWPSTAQWAALNSSVGGRLVATVPLGSPCHDPTYNAAVCKNLQENWVWPQEQ